MPGPARSDVLAHERGFAHELADLAAGIASAGPVHGPAARTKVDGTPVSEIDTGVERALRDTVARRYPRDAFLGEEDGLTGDGDRTWIVDPIDGTANLVDGVPLWSVLIGLVVDGRPALGVADVPGLGERYEAVRGEGAMMNGRPIRVSDVDRLDGAFVLHSGLEEWLADGAWEGFRDVVTGARRTRGLSDAWGHLLVARGSADLVLEHEPCGPWDWTAVQVILEEAGGRITTLEGASPRPGSGLLSSNGRLHDEVVERLRRVPVR